MCRCDGDSGAFVLLHLLDRGLESRRDRVLDPFSESEMQIVLLEGSRTVLHATNIMDYTSGTLIGYWLNITRKSVFKTTLDGTKEEIR